MLLKLILDSLDSLDSAFHPLYTEKDGKFVLTGVEGMKTQADVDAVKTILQKERDEHKATKKKLEDFHSMNMSIDELQEKLDRIDELEAAAGGKLDEAKMNELVEARLKSKMAPLERELEKVRKDALEKDEKISGYETKERTRTIHDAVRQAAQKSKVIDTAFDDVLMLAERVFDVDETGSIITRDNVGVTPGIAPDVWLSDMQNTRPHWWPASQGGGAKGSGGAGGFSSNPFSADNWNMTEQGKLVRTDRVKAEQMAKAAGTTIGGPRPVKK